MADDQTATLDAPQTGDMPPAGDAPRTGDALLDSLPADSRPPQMPSWDDVADQYRKAFPDLDPDYLKRRYTQAQGLRLARWRAAALPVPASEDVLRNSLLGASAAYNVMQARNYSRAKQNLQAGTADDGDLQVIAEYEHRQARDQAAGQTWQGALTQAAMKAPAIAGEAVMAGGALESASSLPGLGFLAPAAESAPLLSRAGAAQLGMGAVRSAAEAPLMPSFWAEKAAQNNLAAGRDATDIRGYPSAIALAMAQNAVLSVTGNITGRAADAVLPSKGLLPAAGKLAAQGAAFPAGQAASDVLTSTVGQAAQRVVGSNLGLDTGYGTLGDLLLRRDPQSALRNATVQALTAVAFHVASMGGEGEQPLLQRVSAEGAGAAPAGGQAQTGTALVPFTGPRRTGTALGPAVQDVNVPPGREAPQPPPAVLGAFARAMSWMAKQGLAGEAAGRRASAVYGRIQAQLDINPDLTRAEARALFERDPAGPLRDFGLALADMLPEGPAGLLPGPGQGPYPAPARPTGPPSVQVVEPGSATDPRVLAAMQARRQAGPATPPPQAPEAPPSAPAPAAGPEPTPMPPAAPAGQPATPGATSGPLADWSIGDVKALARQLGLRADGSREAIIQRMASAVGPAVLEKIAAAQARPAAAPEPQKAAAYEPTPGPAAEEPAPFRAERPAEEPPFQAEQPALSDWHQKYQQLRRQGLAHEAAERQATAAHGRQGWVHTGTEFTDTADGQTEFTAPGSKAFRITGQMDEGRQNITVKAFDPETGEEVGHVLFDRKENGPDYSSPGEAHDFTSADLRVHEKYQGKEPAAVATRRAIVHALYDFAHEETQELLRQGHPMGGRIVPSQTRSKGGKALWQRNAELGAGVGDREAPTNGVPAPAARPQAPQKPAGAQAPPEAGGPLAGHATQVLTAEGGVPARYEVRELGDVRASHQVLPSGALRSRVQAGEYPPSLQPRDYSAPGEKAKVERVAREMAPAVLVNSHPAATEGPPTITEDGTVLNGNGRQMALERAASLGTFEKYKSELVRQAAAFGLDPAAVEKMKRPALYRVANLDPRSEEARRFAAAGNVSLTQGQSPVRTAASLSRLVDDNLIDSLRLEGDTTFSEAVNDPTKGKAFRQRLQDALPPQEASRFFQPDGRLTDAGTELVRNMLLSKVLPAELVERLGEEMRGVKRTLEGAIPQLLKVQRDFPQADISPQLEEALSLWSRNPGTRTAADVDNLLAQGSLFGGKVEALSPGGRMMLDFLLRDGNKPLAFRKKLSALVQDLTGSTGLFGEEYPDPARMAAEALGVAPREGAGFGDLAGAAAGNPDVLFAPGSQRLLENIRRKQKGLAPLPAPRQPEARRPARETAYTPEDFGVQLRQEPAEEPMSDTERRLEERIAAVKLTDLPAPMLEELEDTIGKLRRGRLGQDQGRSNDPEYPPHAGLVPDALKLYREQGAAFDPDAIRETARVAYALGGYRGREGEACLRAYLDHLQSYLLPAVEPGSSEGQRLVAEFNQLAKEMTHDAIRQSARVKRGTADAASLRRGVDRGLQEGDANAHDTAAAAGAAGAARPDARPRPAPGARRDRAGAEAAAAARAAAAGHQLSPQQAAAVEREVKRVGLDAALRSEEIAGDKESQEYAKKYAASVAAARKAQAAAATAAQRTKAAATPRTVLDQARARGGISYKSVKALYGRQFADQLQAEMPSTFGGPGRRAGRDIAELADEMAGAGEIKPPPGVPAYHHLLDQVRQHAVAMTQALDAEAARREAEHLQETAREHWEALGSGAAAPEVAEALRRGEEQGRADAAGQAARESSEDAHRELAEESAPNRPSAKHPWRSRWNGGSQGTLFGPGGGPGDEPGGPVRGGPGGPAAGPGGAGLPGPGAGGRRVSPFELIATMQRLFGLPRYVEGRLQANATALYRLKPEAAEVNKMAAGDAPVFVHELAHHIAKTQGLNLDPGLLPQDVMRGFRQLDYFPNRTNIAVGMQEGFAEWLRRRETDQLQGLTPDQQAAAAFAEKMLASRPGLVEKLDRVRDLFRQFGAQPPSEQFAGQISTTGRPAQPVVRPGEAVGNFLQRTAQDAADNLLDDAMPARRAERAAEARGERFEPGTRLSEVMATTRLRNVPDAMEMEQGGVFAYDQAGRRVGLSLPLKEAVKGLSAEDAAPGGDLDRYMHAARILHDRSTDAVQHSADQVKGAEATLAEYMKDPAKFRRLEAAAQNVTGIFNATLDAMAMAGRITPERAQRLKELHPFYVSEQHVTEPGFDPARPYGGRRRGEEPRTAQFLKQRTGSGEQVINWLDALRDRYRFTAAMVNDQMKFRALLDLSKRAGVGAWLDPGEPGAGPEGEPKGWPRDGSKPSITGYVGGEPVRVRVNDRAFYELVTGTQGEGDRMHAAFKALGDIMEVTRVPQLVRLGGTIFSPLWHVRNFFRDPVLYVQRTIADKGPISNLAELAQWYGKSFAFYTRALRAGGADNVQVRQASDHYFQLMERMAGRELSYGALSGQQTFASRAMDGWHGLLQRISDLATAGEKGTRTLELKNVLDKLGWTQERIAAELKKDPSQRNPVPFAVQVAALDVASQITHNVHQQGVWVRQLNRSWPFLGAHIAGVYKDVQAWRTQPAKAAAGLVMLMAAKGLEWLLNKNDPEYAELPPYLRDGFVFKTPLGWLHFPAPRGLDAPVVGLMGETLRATSASSPRFGDVLRQSLLGLLPQGGPEPLPAAFQLYGNRTWTGRPIVPDREAALMTTGQRLTDPRSIGYAAGQLTGGMLEQKRLGLDPSSLNPFGMDQHPHQSVNDYFDALHDMELRRMQSPERRKGLAFPQEAAYQRLHAVEEPMRALAMELRGERKVGNRVVQAGPPSPERQAAIRQEQVRLARQALGQAR